MRAMHLALALALAVPVSAGATNNPEPAIKAADSGSIDAFGRWRVSNPTSQIHIEQYYDKNPLLIDEELIGTATATFQTNESSTDLATAADLDVAIQQTFNHGQYQAGQSQMVKLTFASFQNQTNIIKRAGYYHCNSTTPFNSNCDGIWLSSESSTYYLNAYRNGTQVDRVAQASWDDPMDGTGPSGVTIDWSKAQIAVIDYQWLGVGRIRFYLDVDGMLIQVHELNHANSETIPYMQNPNQPLRWEIRQTGVGSGLFTSICGEVATEGPQEFIGTTRSASNGTTEISMSADTSYALIGLSIQSSKDHLTVIPSGWSVVATSANDDFEWRICLNPTVADTFAYSAVTNSPAEVAIGTAANTVSDCTPTDGKMVAQGYGATDATINIPAVLRRAIGHSIDGVQDELVLVAKPFAAADLAGGVTWEERY
jgi:hypothetical protein